MEQRREVDDFTIEVVKTEDAENVLKFLRQHFYKVQISFEEINVICSIDLILSDFQHEPIMKCLELFESEEYDKYAIQDLEHGCNFKALNSHGEIVGVFLGSLIKRSVGV